MWTHEESLSVERMGLLSLIWLLSIDELNGSVTSVITLGGLSAA